MMHVPLEAATIDDIHAMFEALITYMGDRWTQANINANKESSGATNCSINCADAAGNSYTFSERIAGPRIVINPPGANLGPGGTQQFSASVTDSAGVPVPSPTIEWSVQPGANGGGSIDPQGKYTAPASVAGNGNDTVTAFYIEGGGSTIASVALHP